MSRKAAKKPTPKNKTVEGTAGQELPGPGESGESRVESGESAGTAEVGGVTVDFRSMSITVPFAAIDPAAHLSRHVEGHLTITQRRGLRRLYNGLDHSGERLRNGKRVAAMIDAVRWLVEKIEEKVNATPPDD